MRKILVSRPDLGDEAQSGTHARYVRFKYAYCYTKRTKVKYESLR